MLNLSLKIEYDIRRKQVTPNKAIKTRLQKRVKLTPNTKEKAISIPIVEFVPEKTTPQFGEMSRPETPQEPLVDEFLPQVPHTFLRDPNSYTHMLPFDRKSLYSYFTRLLSPTLEFNPRDLLEKFVYTTGPVDLLTSQTNDAFVFYFQNIEHFIYVAEKSPPLGSSTPGVIPNVTVTFQKRVNYSNTPNDIYEAVLRPYDARQITKVKYNGCNFLISDSPPPPPKTVFTVFWPESFS